MRTPLTYILADSWKEARKQRGIWFWYCCC